MAKLEDIEQQLYQKEKEAQEKLEQRAKWRLSFPRPRSRAPTTWIPEHRPTTGIRYTFDRHQWGFFLGGVIVILIILAGLFLFFYLRAEGREAQVTVRASENVEAGRIITIAVTYKNISHTTLHDGEIVVTLPPDSLINNQGIDSIAPARIVRPVPVLKPGDQGVVEVSVRLFGQEHENKSIEALYYYRPENLRAQFSARGKTTVRIAKVPLNLSWEVPPTLSRGQDTIIKIHYTLSTPLPFQNMAVQVEYPSGFSFTSADPRPAVGNTLWTIGALDVGKEGVITIHGTVSGDEGEIKSFRAKLGTFNEYSKEFQQFTESNQEITIAVTPLLVQGFLVDKREGVVRPSMVLNFVVQYRNNTNFILKNITIKALLEGSALDMLSIKPSDEGVVDAQTKAIIWGPGNVPALRQLNPHEGGELEIKVTVKDPPPVASSADKNLIVAMTSSIDAASIPDELQGTKLSAQDRIQFNVASKVVFSGKALHGSSILANSGPLPPRVGQTTTYTIVWEVKNFTNDIANAEIVATLPPNVKWEEVTRAEGTMRYDPASSEVRWRIGTLPAGTGVLTPTLTGVFQVSITPAEIDRGNPMRLVNESTLAGLDTFAREDMERHINAMNTFLSFDPTAPPGSGVVQ